jgi:hypothetical protein
MKTITRAALAAAVLAVPVLLAAAPASAQYVGACSYNSKQWRERGVVSCTPGWAPIGFPGTRWKVGRTTQCWNTYGAGGKEYQGYWGPCR